METNQDLSDEAHQPKKFNFPKREFGKTKVIKRSFQPSWFEKWPWLYYNESEDSVLVILVLRLVSRRRFSGL